MSHKHLSLLVLSYLQNMKIPYVLQILIMVLSAFCLWVQGNEARSFSRDLSSTALSSRPPMGWNSWNSFSCNIDDIIIRETADAMVATGLSKFGYEYVNIDDCWGEQNRDAQGNLVARSSAFPSGIKDLADYVHSKGLKLGIYSGAGYYTCSKTMPGSFGHEEQDAQTFASWGIDYLKYDSGDINLQDSYSKMREALSKASRPILYSMGQWDDQNTGASSWKTTGNTAVKWKSIKSTDDQNDQWAPDPGPGGWKDNDLEVGNGKMSTVEYKSQFSISALMKAPLLIGCDIRFATSETLEILGNSEVINVNQDPLKVQGKKVTRQGDLEIWAGPLSNNRVAVIMWNRSGSEASMTAKWGDIGLPSDAVVQARDLWAHSYLPSSLQGSLTSTIGSHACKMYILMPTLDLTCTNAPKHCS